MKKKKAKKLTAAEHKKRYGNRWANYSKEERSEHMRALAKRRMGRMSLQERQKVGQRLTATRIKNSKQ